MSDPRARFWVVLAALVLSLFLLGTAMNEHGRPNSVIASPASEVLYSMRYSGDPQLGATIFLNNTFTNSANSTIRVFTIVIRSDMGQIIWPDPLNCPADPSCVIPNYYPNAIVLKPGDTKSLTLTLTIPENASTSPNHTLYGVALLQLVIPNCFPSSPVPICGPPSYQNIGEAGTSEMIVVDEPLATPSLSIHFFSWILIGVALVGGAIGLATTAQILIRRRSQG